MPGITRENKPGPAIYYIATPTRDFMPIFSMQPLAKQAVLQLRRAARDKDVEIFGYCLLPTMLQAIVGFRGEHDLGAFLYHYKWLVSHAIICLDHGDYHERLYRKGKFKPWMNRFENSRLTNALQVESKLEYLHNEPMKKGLAASVSDWPYSSAADWLKLRQGMIPVSRDIASLLPEAE
jgi:putative transposase